MVVHAYVGLKTLSYHRGRDTHRYLLGAQFPNGFNMASDVPKIDPRREFLLLWRAELDRLGLGHTVSTTCPVSKPVKLTHVSLSLVPETSRYKLEEVDKVFRIKTSQIMSNGWAQLRWLLGKKGRDSRRWVLKDYPELVGRFNDRSSHEVEQEMDDREGSTGSSEAVNEDSEATKDYTASPANGRAARITNKIHEV